MTGPAVYAAKIYDVPTGVMRLILGSYGVATGALMVAAWCLGK